MFKIPLFDLSSVFYTSCAKKEPYLFIGKTHKFKNCLNLMTLVIKLSSSHTTGQAVRHTAVQIHINSALNYIGLVRILGLFLLVFYL